MPASTECAAALLSFRYPSLYPIFSHDNLKKWLKIFQLHSKTSGFVIASQNWNKEFSAPLSVCVCFVDISDF